MKLKFLEWSVAMCIAISVSGFLCEGAMLSINSDNVEGSDIKSAWQNRAATQIKKNNTEFQRIQIETIRAYKRNPPPRKMECSYEDHKLSTAAIPFVSELEEPTVFRTFYKWMNNSEGSIISGFRNVAASMNIDMELLVLWNGVYVNTVQYNDVLYGGSLLHHVGFGTPFPKEFYDTKNDDLRYYDLISCMPFPKWIMSSREQTIKEILLVPLNSHIVIRNAVHGIAAIPLLHEITRNEPSASSLATTQESISGTIQTTNLTSTD